MIEKKYILVAIVGSLPLALWWGVPTYKKAKADAIVDEWCAKDGGAKVYETVKLPPDQFDKYGNAQISFKPKSGNFYLTSESQSIVPYRGEGNISISRYITKVYRTADNKLLGEKVSYIRRGGDPISPAHPSSYSCPVNDGLERKIFVKD